MTRIERIYADFYGFLWILLSFICLTMLYQDKTDLIIKCFYKVYNTLGYGFLEQVYENALCLELSASGFTCEKQKPITVYYKDVKVGSYYADIMVDGAIILELKAADSLRQEHEFQLINYLKATEIEVGLLFNFGKTPEFKRKIFTVKSKPV